MKKLLAALIIANIAVTAYGAFKDPGFGARPMGMGGAFVAVADDINAPLYNPAGVFLPENKIAGFMYAKLYAGLDDVDMGLQHAAFIYPTEKLGAFGLTWDKFASAAEYREDTLILTYAKDIPAKALVPELYAGVNLKYLSHAYGLDSRTVNDPLFANGNSKSAVTADAGLWASVFADEGSETSMGLVYNNITEPDLGLQSTDKVPSEVKLGVKRSVRELGAMQDALLALDVSMRNMPAAKLADQFNFGAGVEAWFKEKTFGARCGLNSTSATGGFSVKQKYSTVVIQLDYALLWPLAVQGTTGSHRVCVSFGF
jgi:hypothetical protein